MTAQPMVARGAQYKALLDTLDQEGAAKLHLPERERLLEAADALLFGEPDSDSMVRSAEVLMRPWTSGRWSVEGCNRLREHLHGCGVPAGEA
jgi:hypothetical protein